MANSNDNTAANVVAFPEVKGWNGRDVIHNLTKRVDTEFLEIRQLRERTYKVPQWIGNVLMVVVVFQFTASLLKNAATGYMTGSQVESAISRGFMVHPFGAVESANFIIFQLSMLSIASVISYFAYTYVSKRFIKWPMLVVALPALFVSLFANLAWAFGVQNATDGSPVIELFKAISGRNYETVQWWTNIFISIATEFSLFFIPLILVYLNTPRRERKESKRLAKELRMSEASKKEMGLALAERDQTENQIQSDAYVENQARVRKTNRKNAKDTLISERKIIVDYLRHNANAGVVKAYWLRIVYFVTGRHSVPSGYIKQIQGTGEKKI